MKILVDANPLFAGPLTGVGYYTKELLESLANHPDIELEGFAFNFRGSKKISTLYKINEQKKLPGKILSYPRYMGIDLPLKTFFDIRGYDIVIGTNYLLPPTSRIPNIVTLHDLCFVDHPEWVQSKNAHILSKMLPKTLERSNGIITISEFSAERIRKVYGYRKPILVISIPPKKSDIGQQKPHNLNINVKGGYFLFISTIEPRKNLPTLLDSYHMLTNTVQKNHPLIIAGKPGWDKKTLERLTNNTNKNIIYLDYVNELERNWLYKNALVTVVPSFYEGFGMMTLESLDMGTPVIVSDIPPQKEIMGSAGLYFNPKDKAKLAEMMKNITNTKYRNAILKSQVKVLKNYSWNKTANQVMSFCDSIIKSQ